MRKYALGQLTVCGARPEELVEIAAWAGYDAISPFLAADGAGSLPAVPLKAGDVETTAMARRLVDTGLRVHVGDGFVLHGATDMDALRAGVALMAQLGARAINAVHFDTDASRGLDRFCQLNSWAREAGLITLIEFTPLSTISGWRDALAYRERAGGDNIALMVDLLHLRRSGGTVEEIAQIDPSLIGAVQLCDGPTESGPQGYREEAMYERMIPGQGSLHAEKLLRVLPKDMLVDLEVPLRSLEQAGKDHFARAKLLLDACRALDLR